MPAEKTRFHKLVERLAKERLGKDSKAGPGVLEAIGDKRYTEALELWESNDTAGYKEAATRLGIPDYGIVIPERDWVAECRGRIGAKMDGTIMLQAELATLDQMIQGGLMPREYKSYQPSDWVWERRSELVRRMVTARTIPLLSTCYGETYALSFEDRFGKGSQWLRTTDAKLGLSKEDKHRGPEGDLAECVRSMREDVALRAPLFLASAEKTYKTLDALQHIQGDRAIEELQKLIRDKAIDMGLARKLTRFSSYHDTTQRALAALLPPNPQELEF